MLTYPMNMFATELRLPEVVNSPCDDARLSAEMDVLLLTSKVSTESAAVSIVKMKPKQAPEVVAQHGVMTTCVGCGMGIVLSGPVIDGEAQVRRSKCVCAPVELGRWFNYRLVCLFMQHGYFGDYNEHTYLPAATIRHKLMECAGRAFPEPLRQSEVMSAIHAFSLVSGSMPAVFLDACAQYRQIMQFQTPSTMGLPYLPGGAPPETPNQRASAMPGDIITQPDKKIVCNAPYSEKNTYNVHLTNNGAHRIGWAIKTTNSARLNVTPPCGVLDAKEACMLTIACEPIDYGTAEPPTVTLATVPTTQPPTNTPFPTVPPTQALADFTAVGITGREAVLLQALERDNNELQAHAVNAATDNIVHELLGITQTHEIARQREFEAVRAAQTERHTQATALANARRADHVRGIERRQGILPSRVVPG